MTKNLHTKIILILLLCFTLVLLAFACTPNGVTVVPDESGGGESSETIDVTGGNEDRFEDRSVLYRVEKCYQNG